VFFQYDYMGETVSQNISACNHVGISEASKQTGISPRTIRRYIAKGELAAIRVGPKILKVDLDEVRALIRPVSVPPDALEQRMKELIAQAPPLSDEQRERIAALLRRGAAA